MTHYAESNYYELLEVDPDSGLAEITEAYGRQLELLSGDSLATYGLFLGDDLVSARQRVEEAYRVLTDPARRRAYDASGYAHAPPPEEPADEPAVAKPPPEPSTERLAESEPPGAAEAEQAAHPTEPTAPAAAPHPAPLGSALARFDGASLRAARERKGVTLATISGDTRIAEYYLEYIEGERFDVLPPAIYLRSYVKQYAAAIGVDPERAVEGYLARYNESKGGK